MYISRLQLKGFKSFGGSHDLILSSGFTAIVGPNGSGKSNILDALRWSLGDSHAGRLRISRQSDLLFQGSISLPAAKEAEVLLRAKGFGITSLDVHGRDNDRSMLIMTMQRKRLPEAISILEEHCNGAVVTVSDIKAQRGGYLERTLRSGQLRNGK